MPLGTYLYCIVRCPDARRFDDVPAVGNPGVDVYTIPLRGVAAVVSDSPFDRYEVARANTVAHERVLERVMVEFPLLPVRFGTVASATLGPAGIRMLLDRRFDEFDRLLTEMEDKAELGLKALWRDEATLFGEIQAENAGIRQLRKQIEGKPAAATHFERVRLGEMVKDALHRKRAAEAERLVSPLRKLAVRVVENPTPLDRMIVNDAFLVDRRQEHAFDRAVQTLDQEVGDRVTLKYVGPVPPYNFVHVVVSWEEVLGQ